MCGIAGFALKDPGARPREWITSTCRAMAGALAHRGPDAEGVWADPGGAAALGHRRLAIIDLSEAGAQPMVSADGQAVLTFNGEIYNYPELAAEVRGAGVLLRGHSDTEALLEGIRLWGLRTTLDKAVGMFAFALWEPGSRQLTLVRGRIGKKPLYVRETPEGLYFASEIKSLARVPGAQLTPDRESLHHYLSLGYIPGPRTAYEEVREVPPGGILTRGPDGSTRTETYWALPAPDPALGAIRLEEAVEETERLVRDAVRLRLRADVEVGTFLSGGIDSGILTAMAGLESDAGVRTFTVAFPGTAVDESGPAAAVAARYGLQHEVIRLAPDVPDLLKRVAAAYDEPFGDPSALPTYAVAEAAARHLKVVINGEGADELFGGYRRASAMRWAAPMSMALEALPRAVVGALERMAPTPRGERTPYSFLHRLLRGAGRTREERYISWSSDGFSEVDKRWLYRGDPGVPSTPAALAERFEHLPGGALRHFMGMDFLLGMTDCLLVKVDIATMAHGLEARCPFLDHRVVEWGARLPADLVVGRRTTKPILRAVAEKYLPAEAVGAPKRGFEIPLTRWMRDDLYDQVVERSLDSTLVGDIFDRSRLEAFLGRRTGLDDERWAKRAWLVFMLAQWDAVR